jgi:hypothetical protein
MMCFAKERKVDIHGAQTDYITFGTGAKPLVMLQGLNTRGIKGSGMMLAWMYRIFAKEYTVYLFDRRADLFDGITRTQHPLFRLDTRLMKQLFKR